MRRSLAILLPAAAAVWLLGCGDNLPPAATDSGIKLPDATTYNGIAFDIAKDTKPDTAATCGGVSCDDQNPCTDDLCGADNKCTHQNNKADCDDGDPCTQGDACSAGKCAPGKVNSCLDGAIADTGKETIQDVPADAPPVKGPDLKPGDLVVTEIMANPKAVQDAVGEWFEVWNATDAEVKLEGLVIKDKGNEKYVVPAGVAIAAKGYLVFGLSADKSVNGGVPVDHVAKFALFNSADAVVLESNGVVIDEVAYDIQKGWPETNGVSLSLAPTATNATANDAADHWCGATTAIGPGLDKGTPGKANDACLPDSDKDGIPDIDDNCPTVANPSQFDSDKNGVGDACEGGSPLCGNKALDPNEACDDGNQKSGDGCSAYCQKETPVAAAALVISEFMPNPAGVADDVGEWIEVYNPGAQDVELNGVALVIGSANPIQHVVESSAPVVVPAGGYLLLANNGDAALNGGLKPAYVYKKLLLSSTAATLSLKSGATVVDTLTYNPKWPIVAGKAVQLDPGKLDAAQNDAGANWCKALQPYGDKGDFGTPGTVNAPCAASASADEEGDGVPDQIDNCPSDKNPKQEDSDGDTIGDPCDNCKDVTNTDQLDSNQNGVGDACEPPGCGNGVLEPGEACEDGNNKTGDGCNGKCQVEAAPAPGGLVITEILPDPKAVPDDAGEWIELYNPTTVEVELTGLTVRAGNNAVLLAPPDSVVVPPGGYKVIGRSTDKAVNGGAAVDLAYKGLSLPNSGTGTVRIEAGPVLIDQIVYGSPGGALPPNSAGAVVAGSALQLSGSATPTATDNDLAVNWCLAAGKYGSGDFGSPGAGNPPCAAPAQELAPGALIVTELMPSGLGGSNDLGEWFELKNATDKDIDLSGVAIKYKSITHVIKGTGPMFVKAGASFVIGREIDPAKNGGAPVGYTYGSAIALSNSDGNITLEAAGKVVDTVSYTSAKPWPGIKAGVSIQLDAGKINATDNDKGENWCLSVDKFGGGNLLGTPAAANVACKAAPPPPPPPQPGNGKPDAGFGRWGAFWRWHP
jgi:cysteine-rich repeat protein